VHKEEEEEDEEAEEEEEEERIHPCTPTDLYFSSQTICNPSSTFSLV
jgi:hypothetical protein